MEKKKKKNLYIYTSIENVPLHFRILPFGVLRLLELWYYVEYIAKREEEKKLGFRERETKNT